uniref:ABC-2 type transporter transmembrane domain-containing protein n=1 Tax=Romanomermis culicivorax TaxID=13658 RepID=A0A915KYT1_ROMCU
MAEGRLAYFGSNKDALTFFASLGYPCPTDFNPADFFVHMLAIQPGKEEECRERLNNICGKYVESEYYKEMSNLIACNQRRSGEETNNIMDMEKPQKTSRCVNCTMISTHIQYQGVFHNHTARHETTLIIPVMAIFVGLIYLNTTYDQEGVMNINGGLFFILAEYSFPAIFGVITILPLEFPVVVREHHNGMYRVLTYYLSKVISFVSLRRTLSAFLWTLLIGVLLEQCSSAFGTMMSAVSPSFALAVTIVGPIMTVIEMTGGLFINIATIPFYLSWSQYISWFRYGYEAMFIANFNKDMILMVVLYLAFHFFGYLGLSIRAYKAR